MHTLVTITAQCLIAVPVLAWCVTWWCLGKSHRRWSFIILTAASLVVTFLLAKLASSLHSDPRPFIRDHVTPYFAGSNDNGFPSDHTTYSAMLAFIVMRFNRKAGVALLVLAALIGTARVIAGVHHGQDIIAGLIIAGIGVGICAFAQRAIERARSKPDESKQ
jgi:membrane-associated phospholipid phosphatase